MEGEVAVLCPFPHTDLNGDIYYETNPSAHVNVEEGLFHCKVCQRGYSQLQFTKEILGCSTISAFEMNRLFQGNEDYHAWKQRYETSGTLSSETFLNINREVIDQLHIIKHNEHDIEFPVFMYGKLLDIRTYDPDPGLGEVKVKSRYGASAGLIVPFDIWQAEPKTRVTSIVAGEKDMAIARSQGFNAITLTGGERTLPIQRNYFKDREVVIMYDNDAPGVIGAVKLALDLQPIVKSIKVVTGFHEVCVEKGEDIHDFFVKYGKTPTELIRYIEDTPEFSIDLYPNLVEELKPVTLHEAGKPENIKKTQRSKVQVTATAETVFSAPIEITAEKFQMSDQSKFNLMDVGEVRAWELKEHKAKDLLHLIDNNFNEKQIKANKKKIMKIPDKEAYISMKELATETVYKCTITDMFESTSDNVKQTEYLAYSIGTKLESGKKYDIKYRLVPHPYKGRTLVMIIFEAHQAADTVDTFQIDDMSKQRLKTIRDLPGTVEDKVNHLVEKVKGILGYDGNAMLIKTIDLAYHTPLKFNYAHYTNVRGYLDTIIVGESRTGKSSTAEALRSTYGLGTITSLAGNSATVAGLIGGSNKVNGSFQTRAGIIPQNHRGLMFFEEFGKCNSNLIKELTDIRSSNEVRITRVSGTLTLPALVRMIALTNVKSSGEIKSIASYPNGIEVITDLVGSAEDIARYDIMLVLADRGNPMIDPYWEPEEPYDKSIYRDKIRWVWSRTPDKIIIDNETGHYLRDKANEINRLYNTHIKIFGTEAWKKLARLAIAVAGYVVSTDDSFENIIVKKEHIDYAFNYYVKIYDNNTFKLGPYVRHERKYTTIDDDGVALLQMCFDKAPGLIMQLEQVSKSNKAQLTASSGLDRDEYNAVMSKLVGGQFIKYYGTNIMPTERFRLGMGKINRQLGPRGLGDQNVGLSSN